MKILILTVPNPNIVLRIPPSVADTAAVNLNGIKMILGNGLSTLPIKGKKVLSNGFGSLPKNPPDFHILYN